MTGRTFPRSDARLIAETCADLADKVLYWKDRALRAEEAERKFASEIYTPSRLVSPPPARAKGMGV